MSYKLTAESEEDVKRAVGQAEETREHEPVLAPIDLTARTAEQLLAFWHETEEAMSCRGFMRPETPIKAPSRHGEDRRIYVWVEAEIFAYGRAHQHLDGLNLRAIARHWLDESGGVLVLSKSVSESVALDRILRWLGMTRETFANRIMAGLISHIDKKKNEKGLL